LYTIRLALHTDEATIRQYLEQLVYLVYLAAGLIVFGMFGSHFASAVIRHLSKLVVALTSPKKSDAV
jgi:hypothetical protein